jgi:hypothetical protein
VDGELDGPFPRAVGFEGKSYDPALFCDDAVFFPPGTELTGNYEYRSILRDREGNGWDIVAPFQVVSLFGDYNGNNLVEQSDLDLVLLNWGATVTPAGWTSDLPSGPIDQQELDGVLLTWGNTIAAAGIASAAVPEPNGIVQVLLALTMALMSSRRSAHRR